jgi:hypothetical protein
MINFGKVKKSAALCISALFIISILSVLSITPVQATTSTLGNTVVNNNVDTNDANAQSVSYFQCTTTQSVTDIMAYIDGASSGNCIAALYAVNGNSAGTLLAQSNPVNIGTTFTWVDLQLQTPYTITAGTTYGLAIMGNVPVNIMIASGTGQRDHNAVSSYTKGFANPFGAIWGTDNTGAMSIYATGTTTTTPTPTPTAAPTPTPTPTPKPTQTPTPTPKPTLPPSTTSSNLASIPSAWYIGDGSGNLRNGHAYIYQDSYVEHTAGNPSIRVDTDGYYSRDVYLPQWTISANPGDHIVFKCWIKTGDAGTNNGNLIYGRARIGIDLFIQQGSNWYDTAWHPDSSDDFAHSVPYGRDWTQVTWDLIVPSSYTGYDFMTGIQHTGTPISIGPWLQALPYTTAPSVWFADAELYINP